MEDFFLQIVLFLTGAVIGIVTQAVSRFYLKLLGGILAVLLIAASSAWIGYELGRRQVPQTTLILASSTFDKDADGWTIDGGGEGPYYKTTGGNPGGYIMGNDKSGDYPDWFWKSPQEFLGDQSEAYGGVLFFALTQNDTTNPATSTNDVILVGEGIKLIFDISSPGSGWTEYAIWLHERGGWKKDNDDTPTEAEMRRVLSSLSELEIHAEYREGDDTGSLDNVMLLRHP